MRIGIDYHVLNHGWQGSGIQRYIEGLSRAVLNVPSKNEWVFFVEDTNAVPNNWPGSPEWRGIGTSSRIARLGWRLNNCIHRDNIDCCHFQFTSPLIKTCNEVVTVHDVLFETHPQFFPKSTQYTLKPLVKRSAHRASMILTVSEYSKQTIVEHWGIPAEKIHLTQCAVDRAMFNPGDTFASKDIVKNAYSIENYILSVGRIEPRKNHWSIVQSYAYLKSKGKSLPKLVLVGGKDFGYSDLASKIYKLGLGNDVIFLDSISDQMLPHLYRAALVMVYPSFAEGFGIPPLEAMACGCPVITSNSTALKEVVGASAWLIDPYQWPTLADAIWEAIQSPSQLTFFVGKGLEQAAGFTWEKSAKTLLSVYNQLE